MVRSAVYFLLFCTAMLMWGTASGRADIFVAGAAPDSAWSMAGEFSEEHKHCHDSPTATIESAPIDCVAYVESSVDHQLPPATLDAGSLIQLRGPPRI